MSMPDLTTLMFLSKEGEETKPTDSNESNSSFIYGFEK